MRYHKIIFYNDCYDDEQLVWKGNKEYNISVGAKYERVPSASFLVYLLF